MPKIYDKIVFHLPMGASMFRQGAIAPSSPPLAPPMASIKFNLKHCLKLSSPRPKSILGLGSDLLQCRDSPPRTPYLNFACCKNAIYKNKCSKDMQNDREIPLASVYDEQIPTMKSRNDFNYSPSRFFDVTNAFRLMSFLLRMLLSEFFRRTPQKSVSGDWP